MDDALLPTSSVGAAAPPGFEALLARNRRGELHRNIAPGTVVDGKWELTRRLGRGGFGEVYEAWHLELERDFAIKFLDREHEQPAVQEAFVAEARLMSRLVGDHLVRVYDFGRTTNGVPYFVMDRVAGPSLRQSLRQGACPADPLDIARGLVAGLVQLHAQGYVHGDIKPENIALSERGTRVRLVDYGMAQVSARATGRIGGTPPYMAPEVLLRGARPDFRSDLYAAGVVIHELLTGRLPRGHLRDTLETMAAGWAEHPAADIAALDDERMVPVLRGVLDPDPARRPPSARALLDALPPADPQDGPLVHSGEALGTTAPHTIPARTLRHGVRRSRRLVGALGLLATAGALGLAAWPPSEPSSWPDLHDAVVVAAPRGDSSLDPVFDAMCRGLGGPHPVPPWPTRCVHLDEGPLDDAALLRRARDAGARAVVVVRPRGVMLHAFPHADVDPLIAHLDGLELPPTTDAASSAAAVLRTLVIPGTHDPSEIPALDPDTAGLAWAIVAEVARGDAGDPHAARTRRRDLVARCDRVDDHAEVCALATLVHLRAPDTACATAEPSLASLASRRELPAGLRSVAMLERAACAVEDTDPTRALAAAAMVREALDLTQDDPCVRLAAVGTVSRLAARGADPARALRVRTVDDLPPPGRCGRALRGRVLGVRGDVLAEHGRWCEAATVYADAYQAGDDTWTSLVNWAEYLVLCDRAESRPPSMDQREALLHALTTQPHDDDRRTLSLAYLRWSLTGEPSDAVVVLDRFRAVSPATIGLADHVAEDLAAWRSEAPRSAPRAYDVLTQPKTPTSERALRRALGLP